MENFRDPAMKNKVKEAGKSGGYKKVIRRFIVSGVSSNDERTIELSFCLRLHLRSPLLVHPIHCGLVSSPAYALTRLVLKR